EGVRVVGEIIGWLHARWVKGTFPASGGEGGGANVERGHPRILHFNERACPSRHKLRSNQHSVSLRTNGQVDAQSRRCERTYREARPCSFRRSRMRQPFPVRRADVQCLEA